MLRRCAPGGGDDNVDEALVGFKNKKRTWLGARTLRGCLPGVL